MATRTTVTLVDDLDGTDAERTVSFGLEGVDYDIDLSGVHAQAFRDALAPYIAAARRSGARRTARGAATSRTVANGNGGPVRSRSVNSEIRAWAARHGVALGDRGRIPTRVIEAFETGDPTRLPTNGANPTTAAPDPAVSAPPGPAAGPSADEEEPRGRDGLTATERETIRGWALEQGIEVKTRGQLKKDLIGNYRAWESRPR